jgi:hypothetical protein
VLIFYTPVFTALYVCEQAQVRQSAQACQRLRALAPMLEAQYKAALTARSEAARAEQDRRQTLNDGFQEMISEMTVKIEVYTYILLYTTSWLTQSDYGRLIDASSLQYTC